MKPQTGLMAMVAVWTLLWSPTRLKGGERIGDPAPCYLDGVSDAAFCGSVVTPLDFDRPDLGTIRIHFAILPARGTGGAADPLLIFTGGPGQAASDYGRYVEAAFGEVRKTRDILLIDQRGTGRSHRLDCDFGGLPTDYSSLANLAEACRLSQDVPVELFTLENVVRDTEVVRARLGYQKLNLWGGSFGTRTAALYLRRHPDRVRTLILDGVLPPETRLFAIEPSGSERAMRRLLQDCSDDRACRLHFPDPQGSLAALLDSARTDPLVIPVEDGRQRTVKSVPVDRDWVAQTLRTALYSAERASILPLVIKRALARDSGPLGALIEDGARVGATMAVGATLSVLCADEVPRVTPREAGTLGGASFTQDSYYRFWANACRGWKTSPPAPDTFAPVGGPTPTLVLSGELDPITPPELGERFVSRFPNGRHIVVPGTGHNTSHVGCMPTVLGEFIETAKADSLDDTCLTGLRRPSFVIDEAGPEMAVRGVEP